MEGSFNNEKRRRMFLLGVGLFAFTFLASLAYSELSYDSYAHATSQAIQLQTRLDNFLTVRGKINSVVEALSDNSIPFANPSLAIDQRVWNLQAAWSDFRDDSRAVGAGARFLTPAPSALDAAMDQFALAALRDAVALRQGNSDRVERQAQTIQQINSTLGIQLKAMEHQVTEAIRTAEASKVSATTGIRYGRSVAYGSFIALSSLLVARLLVSGMRGFKEWIGRESVATLEPEKVTSAQR